MVKTRIAPRYRVMKAAKIEFVGGAIDCTVRDLSITGAALEVPNKLGIPAKFTLVMPGDGLHLPCHVVWRREYRIGVAFD
jgi:PilZ domain